MKLNLKKILIAALVGVSCFAGVCVNSGRSYAALSVSLSVDAVYIKEFSGSSEEQILEKLKLNSKFSSIGDAELARAAKVFSELANNMSND